MDNICARIADRVPAYLDRRQADLIALAKALVADDVSTIQSIGHNMKGTGSSYGFQAITELGGRIEAAAKAHNRIEIETGVEALKDYLATIVPGDLSADTMWRGDAR